MVSLCLSFKFRRKNIPSRSSSVENFPCENLADSWVSLLGVVTLKEAPNVCCVVCSVANCGLPP